MSSPLAFARSAGRGPKLQIGGRKGSGRDVSIRPRLASNVNVIFADRRSEFGTNAGEAGPVAAYRVTGVSGAEPESRGRREDALATDNCLHYTRSPEAVLQIAGRTRTVETSLSAAWIWMRRGARVLDHAGTGRRRPMTVAMLLSNPTK
jgi:hypothetical protein